MVRNDAEADDLAQEVFRRAWKARERYSELGLARPYLLKIADRIACDRARQDRREVNLDQQTWERIEPSISHDPAARLRQSETRRQLEAALDRLTPTQRRVLLLRYYGQMSFAQIAESIPCPLSTALSHCRRGLTALRELMTETVPHGSLP
jgi:RNA polymerase sigma-70 factor, ECF subfamily